MSVPPDKPQNDRQPSAAIFHLTDEDVREFQQLVQENCGVWMPPAEATGRANALLSLASAVIGPEESEPATLRVQTSSHLPFLTESSRVNA